MLIVIFVLCMVLIMLCNCVNDCLCVICRFVWLWFLFIDIMRFILLILYDSVCLVLCMFGMSIV